MQKGKSLQQSLVHKKCCVHDVRHICEKATHPPPKKMISPLHSPNKQIQPPKTGSQLEAWFYMLTLILIPFFFTEIV